MIYIIGCSDIDYYNEEHGTDYPNGYDITDEQFKEVCDAYGWTFENWEQFCDEFNHDTDLAPCPNEHYIREIN